MSVLARRKIRLAAVAALSALTGVTVESPGDWDLPPSKLPNLRVRILNERKTSLARTMPEFTTIPSLQVLATLQAPTVDEAQDQLDALGQLIEVAVFGWMPLVRVCQHFPNVTTEMDIKADGQRHVGRILMTVDCETFETFDPTELDPAAYPALQEIQLHVDTLQPFDPTGTYVNPPFPSIVTPAPRTTGPDGRDEAQLHIDLPQ